MSTNNNSVPDFAARFAAASTQSLIEEFNRQVGSNAWTSTRAVHDQALIAELQGRGIDISAVNDGHSTDFSHHVCLDEATNSLVQINYPKILISLPSALGCEMVLFYYLIKVFYHFNPKRVSHFLILNRETTTNY